MEVMGFGNAGWSIQKMVMEAIRNLEDFFVKRKWNMLNISSFLSWRYAI
jgi:hypothetical protein